MPDRLQPAELDRELTPIEESRAVTEPRILLFRGRGWLSKLIRWQTNGDYSHVAVELPDGRVIEAWHTTGVRTRGPLKDRAGVEAYVVDGITPAQWMTAIDWMLARVGDGYDFGGVARFLTRWRKDRDTKWFCSELVFEALRVAGVPLLARCHLSQVSPVVLSFSPLLKPTNE